VAECVVEIGAEEHPVVESRGAKKAEAVQHP